VLEEWHYEPARDLGLRGHDRRQSLSREVGLVSASSSLAWRGLTRAYLAVAHRVTIRGRGNLPLDPPFVMVANHSSHLDAVVLAAALPVRHVARAFPIAAGDTFFTKPARSIFATACMNALPIWRSNCGAHSLDELRERLTTGASIFILFPEGTRTRTGAMSRFKPGVGRLVAGTSAAVVPCYLRGTWDALPPTRSLPRPSPIELTIGKPLSCQLVPNNREGWETIAAGAESAVRELAGG
jgi:1-acyl-sn-glycerol-3-phosphate acyltransferase